MAAETQKGIIPPTGCYIDGHWGIYSSTRLILHVASEFVTVTNRERRLATAFARGWGYRGDFLNSLCEAVWEMADVILDRINEALADGFHAGWRDGEFFIMEDEWWDDES